MCDYFGFTNDIRSRKPRKSNILFHIALHFYLKYHFNLLLLFVYYTTY